MIELSSVRWLFALWVCPALLAVLWYSLRARRAAVQRFADPALAGRLIRGRYTARRVVKGVCICLAIGSVITALSRPLWGTQPREIRKYGRDVCFVIDVSRSMLAEDLAPNRLERAKMWVRDTLEVVRGDRVALVAFAGTAVVKCPLTHDYGFFRMALEDVSPTSVSRGGTLIGDALRTATTSVFDTEEAGHRDIILITDGEDHESFPVEAAAAAGQAGIRIIAIGIGDEDVGSPIYLTDEATGIRAPLYYEGEQVLSRLDAATLREVALSSAGGQYLNVATGTIALDDVYERLVIQAEQQEFASQMSDQLEERFQLFLVIALTLLFAESLIGEVRYREE
ncbi:MAG: VWA domain-containing protein [Planctomycetes bacterium]|nr:VWA domain-containing protein [Planctomycetota bacterium]NOG55833.1 VWA domain-containing protein [Planctomycetota bacterium]